MKGATKKFRAKSEDSENDDCGRIWKENGVFVKRKLRKDSVFGSDWRVKSACEKTMRNGENHLFKVVIM